MAAEKSITLFVSVMLLCSFFLACGGTPPKPQSSSATSVQVNSPICLACPPDTDPPPTGNPYLNTSMIGKTFTLQNDDHSCTTWIDVRQPPASDYYPSGSIMLHISKSAPACYWSPGDPQASINFIVSPLGDGSLYSPGWVIYFGGAVPAWVPCHVSPCSSQVQAPAGAATAYLFVPPAALDDHTFQFIDTSYDRWDQAGENFNRFISGDPAANVHWKTAFYKKNGLAVAEAWEGQCGHEIWSWDLLGPKFIQFPNDGSPGCMASPASSVLTRVP